MNRESFYTGIGMLVVPPIFYLVYKSITQVDLGLVILGIVGLSYFGTALFLIIKGVLTEN